MECVIRNIKGHPAIGESNRPTEVSNLMVTDAVQLGSYNFSETSVVGYSSHVLRDVDPDEMDERFFISPSSIFSSLASREFPPYDLFIDGRKVIKPRTLQETTIRGLGETTIPLSKDAADAIAKLQEK